MHRLLVDTASLESEAPVLSSEAAAHLKVVRPKSGERVELFDGMGRTREYAVTASSRGFVLAAAAPVVEFQRPPAMTLFACVTKGSRWDWTIEKATELGVTRIVPVVSARTIVRIADGEREAKRRRWERVAADAARQSDAKWLPEVLAPTTFPSSPGRAGAGDLRGTGRGFLARGAAGASGDRNPGLVRFHHPPCRNCRDLRGIGAQSTTGD